MRRALFLFAAISVWYSQPAEAGCSGSGLTFSCTARTSPGQINSTLGKARDGATLTFEAGSYAWGGGTRITPSIGKGVTFACATQGACAVTWSGIGFDLPIGTSEKLYRWTGFQFIHPAGGGQLFYHCPGGKCPDTTLSKIRIDHNTFDHGGNEQIIQTDGATVLRFYGSFDNNTVNLTNQQAITLYFSTLYVARALPSRQLGSPDNFFVEDNRFVAMTSANNGSGILDGWGPGAAVVWRFNYVQNARILMHGTRHGFGPSNWEVYGNQFVKNAGSLMTGYRTVHHQGSGTFGAWGNSFTTTGHDTSTIAVLHYRGFEPIGAPGCDGNNPIDGNRSPTATYRGYPCFHQPGRDWDGVLFPTFAFLNFWTDNGAKTDLAIDSPGYKPEYTTSQLVPNRDVYNAVSSSAQTSPTSPFNGTTGIGHGTLANRPKTCTTTTEAADVGRGGVLYWATDQGNWNSSSSNPQGVQQNGADGVLYICSATNTWTVYYTPYAYPHPLQDVSSSGGGGAPQAPLKKSSVELFGLAVFASVLFAGRRPTTCFE